jgi:phage shock protein A
MSIFKRIGDLVRSNVNDALDKAEDPRKVLEQSILDMEGELKKVKQKLLESMTVQKQEEKRAENARKATVEWEAKAMAALKSGMDKSDELARAALAEKQKKEEEANEAEQGVVTQRAQNEELKRQVTMFEEKIGEAKRKKDELIARLNAADMKKKQAAIHSGTDGSAVSDASAFNTFDRMAAKIENSEAEVEARSELMGMNAPDSAASLELDKAVKAQTAEDELAKLKAKMQGGAAAPAKTPDAKAGAIEDELAALKAKLGG